MAINFNKMWFRRMHIRRWKLDNEQYSRINPMNKKFLFHIFAMAAAFFFTSTSSLESVFNCVCVFFFYFVYFGPGSCCENTSSSSNFWSLIFSFARSDSAETVNKKRAQNERKQLWWLSLCFILYFNHIHSFTSMYGLGILPLCLFFSSLDNDFRKAKK